MNYIFISLCFVIGFSSTFGQGPLVNGSCPKQCKPTFDNVCAEQLTGIWYVQSSIPYFYEKGGNCVYINNTKISDNLLKFEKVITLPGGKRTVVEGTTKFTSNGHFENFYTNLNLPMASQLIAVTPDYLVEVACHTCGFFQKEGSGRYTKVYTRFAFPSCEMVKKAVKIALDCGISQKFLIAQDFSKCSHC